MDTDRVAQPRSMPAKLAAGLVLALIGACLLVALGALAGAASYLGYLATRGTVFDIWGALSVAVALCSLIGVIGAVHAALRRRLGVALAFAVLVFPPQLVLEGSRCDTAASCQLLSWASLPPGVTDWRIRLRPVQDANEARALASELLARSDSKDSPFIEKRFADRWIVSTIKDDGTPGAHAVEIQTRTAQARLIPCPADRIRCGMEWPVVSDGRRAFRDAPNGLAAIFPASRVVCTARTGEEARGFDAQVRAPDIPCEIFDQSRQLGLELAPSRKGAGTLAQALTVPCRPLRAESAGLFGAQPPALAGQPSLACERREGGYIQISVYALAPGSNVAGAPARLYEAYIVTTPADLAEDVQALRAMLETARIGVAPLA